MGEFNNVDDEVAAAEAALKTAQERLRVAREKQAQGGARSGESGQGGQAAGAGWAGQGFAQGAPGAQGTWSQPRGGSYQPYGWAGSQEPGGWQAQSQPYSQPYTQQPYGQAYQQPPYTQSTPRTKDHVAAGLLAIFLGSLGIHKFYLGYNTPGFIMLAVTIVGSIFSLGIAGLAMVVISIVEGVLYLSKSQTEFEQTYVFNKKEWF